MLCLMPQLGQRAVISGAGRQGPGFLHAHLHAVDSELCGSMWGCSKSILDMSLAVFLISRASCLRMTLPSGQVAEGVWICLRNAVWLPGSISGYGVMTVCPLSAALSFLSGAHGQGADCSEFQDCQPKECRFAT